MAACHSCWPRSLFLCVKKSRTFAQDVTLSRTVLLSDLQLFQSFSFSAIKAALWFCKRFIDEVRFTPYSNPVQCFLLGLKSLDLPYCINMRQQDRCGKMSKKHVSSPVLSLNASQTGIKRILEKNSRDTAMK